MFLLFEQILFDFLCWKKLDVGNYVLISIIIFVLRGPSFPTHWFYWYLNNKLPTMNQKIYKNSETYNQIEWSPFQWTICNSIYNFIIERVQSQKKKTVTACVYLWYTCDTIFFFCSTKFNKRETLMANSSSFLKIVHSLFQMTHQQKLNEWKKICQDLVPSFHWN